MKQYWPMVVALEHDGPTLLFTYDSCLSVEACESVFKLWQDAHHYKLLVTWIDCIEGEYKTLIEHKCHVNAIGQVKKI